MPRRPKPRPRSQIEHALAKFVTRKKRQPAVPDAEKMDDEAAANAYGRALAIFHPLANGEAIDPAAIAELSDTERGMAFVLGLKFIERFDQEIAHESKARRVADAVIDRLDKAAVTDDQPRRDAESNLRAVQAARVRELLARFLHAVHPQISRWAQDEAEATLTQASVIPDEAKILYDAIVAGPKRWKSMSTGMPFFGDRDGKHVVIAGSADTLAALTAEQQEAAWRVVSGLDEETAQLAIFVLGRCMGEGLMLDGSSQWVSFNVKDSLAFRGYAPHHKGGFRAQHKREERDRIFALSRVMVPIRTDALPGGAEPKTKKGRAPKRTIRYTQYLHFEIEVEGDLETAGATPIPLFDFPGNPGNVPYSFHVSLGRWANPILRSAKHLRVVFATVAQYRADRSREERLASRIGMALAFRWSSKQYTQIEYTVRELIADIKVEKPKQHSRAFREDFEGALQRLREDGVVAEIEYKWLCPEDNLTGKWFTHWLSSRVVFNAPPAVVAFYRNEIEGPRSATALFLNGRRE